MLFCPLFFCALVTIYSNSLNTDSAVGYRFISYSNYINTTTNNDFHFLITPCKPAMTHSNVLPCMQLHTMHILSTIQAKINVCNLPTYSWMHLRLSFFVQKVWDNVSVCILCNSCSFTPQQKYVFFNSQNSIEMHNYTSNLTLLKG